MPEKFNCKDGREVTIDVNEFNYDVTVRDVAGREIGSMEFKLIDDLNDEYLKLAWAYLDKIDKSYCNNGIGRRCLELVTEASGLSIIAEDNDGHQQSDGSHLTGDAPGFVARMRKEGLILGTND